MKYKKEKHTEMHASHAAHTAEKPAPNSLFGDPVTLVLGIIVILLLAYIGYNSMNSNLLNNNGTGIINGSNLNQTPAKPAKTTIELFVMSKCPYGVQAESAVKNVIDKFGGDVNLSLHFIASQTGSGTFNSLHGDTEVAEDLRQVCIMKYYPQNVLNYLSCIIPSYPNFENVWETCTTKTNMDVNLIRTCSTGSEGASLLSDNIKRSNDLNVQASPTVYLSGQPYNGAASETSITKGVCAIIPTSDTCKNLPPEVPVYLTIVNDKSCIVCDTSQITGVLTSQFEINNLTTRTVDYSSDEGKTLVKQFNLTGVPAYIFDSSIRRHSSYDTLGPYLVNIGDFYLLSQQAVPPSKLLNVVEAKDTFVLFVMSHCPYGVRAENNTNVLLQAIPGLKFGGLRFIATQNANGSFSSLHGADEVAEDLRQVCIMKYYPDKIINYTACLVPNYTNSGNIWQNCSSANGIDVSKIQTCSTGSEGSALLAENIAISNSLQIGSSPTILLNNNTLLNGYYAASPELMRRAVCSYNPALVGCNNTLSGATGAAPSAGGCG